MSDIHDLLADAMITGEAGRDIVARALATVRTHLNMDVAYLSEFVDGQAVFRAVDAPGLEHMIKPGDAVALENVYCQHILDGRLPELISDTSEWDLAMSLPITQATPIGSHVSIPIRKDDGSVYGMFCCLGARPNNSLNPRDLDIMRVFADMSAREINRSVKRRIETEANEADIAAIFGAQGFDIAYQPIFGLGAERPAGFEALCRFTIAPYRTPDVWFARAGLLGRQVELELCVIARALTALRHLPERTYVSVNASPETVVQGGLEAIFAEHPCEQIMLEVTEHARVDDYDALEAALAPLRFRGVSLAIDDAGAGFSGLQHIVRLRPDVLKLDMSLTRGIDTDPARRSLTAALVHFASETRAEIVAEGIETQAELAMLRKLGVHRGQGYHLGRLADLAAALAWFRSDRAARPAVA